MGDYLLYISARALSALICVLPIEASLFLARILGLMLYYSLPKKAKTCYLNLKMALGDELSAEHKKRITKDVFKNLVMNFVELLYFPKVDAAYINRHVKIIGKDRIKEIFDRKKGLIFLTAHFGNWELSSLVGNAQGYPIVVLAREQKLKKLNFLLNSFRQRLGSKIISRGRMMRDLLNSLRNNEAVGILADQKAGTTGILTDFFSRLAFTPTGAVTMSVHTGAGILPVFMIREKGSFHRIEFNEELIVDKDDYRQTLEEFNRLLEKYVRKFPSQWLWLHRRWKASPNKNILILSDGKAGHLNQAKAVAKIVNDVIKERVSGLRFAVSGEIIKIREVEVEFRNRFAKVMVNVFGLFCAKKCTGCLRCLKLSLKKNAFNAVSHFFADIVISCGWNLAALNLILSRDNQAKSIVVMKPGLIPIKRFDLAIIPAHDQPKPRKNIVITQAALNLVNEEAIREGIQKLQAAGCRLQAGKIKIGVLIGGESKNYTLTKEIANILVEELLNAAKDLDAQLLVTTSRRTTKEVDSLIKKRLSGNPSCPFLIIANDKNIEGAVPGILGLSDIVVVSGESISMISEALSSRKPVVVFEMQKRGRVKNTKHKRFLDNLVSKNYLGLVKPEGLSEKIKNVYTGPKAKEILRDKELVSEAIRKMI